MKCVALSDTVATRNYEATNEQQGWLGVRFQAEPDGQPNQILLHINLEDPTAQLQQQAIGTLGVNLIYAAYHQRSSSGGFLAGLFDDLSLERLEIDVLELTGPVFAGADSRLWCLDLLRMGMSHALVFDSKAQVVEPATPFRKRPPHRTAHPYAAIPARLLPKPFRPRDRSSWLKGFPPTGNL